MSTLRHLAVVCLVVASLALAVGAGGFSSAAADRSIEVAVVSDEEAFLGFEQTLSNTNTTTGTTDVEVTITNQFAPGTTLETIEVTVDGRTARLGPLHSGEKATEHFTDVDCGSTIHVDASDSDVEVDFNREIREC